MTLKRICLRIFVLFCYLVFFAFSDVEGSTKKEGIENFPSSYQPYLKEIAKKHPNWKWIALETNLDWNNVIANENQFGKNLVPKNYSDSWKNTKEGIYNVEVDSGWVDSSKKAVEYAMDPRNFLNEIRIFQFETLSYDSGSNLTSIDKILYGTEFYQKQVSYYDGTSNLIHMRETYADLILRAGQTSKVSPYHLASRIKQEVGPFLSHSSISGTVDGFRGLYNFYNIGATSSSEPMGAIKKGLQYARDGKGASEEKKARYLLPWNSKERAITGGAIFIGSSYINLGQNTIYLQKFDVNDERPGNLFSHQYMTNVLAPFSEAKSIYQGYQKTGILNTAMTFIIPIYQSMPEQMTENPNINLNDFVEEQASLRCKGSNVNVRTGPSTSYEVLTMANYGDKMKRLKKGISSGEKWDKVELENGMIGYIFQSYVEEFRDIQIESINLSLANTELQKGERKKLEIAITPEEAKENKIIFSSNHPEVAMIDEKGEIYGVHSGKATITAKAEGNNVQSSIEITVYSPVTEIFIEQDEIFLPVEEQYQINSYVKPEDANRPEVTYESKNPEIAIVDETGRVRANKEGETSIIVISEENPSIQKECKIIVVRKMEEEELAFDETISLNGLELSGIDYLNPTVSNVLSKITTKLEVEVLDQENQILKATDIVGTGSKIRIKENENVLREYRIILYGDINRKWKN